MTGATTRAMSLVMFVAKQTIYTSRLAQSTHRVYSTTTQQPVSIYFIVYTTTTNAIAPCWQATTAPANTLG
eukprot:1922821-Amphidinium_carterae.1